MRPGSIKHKNLIIKMSISHLNYIIIITNREKMTCCIGVGNALDYINTYLSEVYLLSWSSASGSKAIDSTFRSTNVIQIDKELFTSNIYSIISIYT